MEKIIKVTKTAAWYKKGDEYKVTEVGNYFKPNEDQFIHKEDCVVINSFSTTEKIFQFKELDQLNPHGERGSLVTEYSEWGNDYATTKSNQNITILRDFTITVKLEYPQHKKEGV